MTWIRLVGFVDGGVMREPGGRLVLACDTPTGDVIAFLGRVCARSTIDTILKTRLPCTVDCDPHRPGGILPFSRGYTLYVPEGAKVGIYPGLSDLPSTDSERARQPLPEPSGFG